MIQTKTRDINGHAYEVTEFPAVRSLRIAIRLAKLIGPGLGRAVGEAGVSGIMDGKLSIGDAVQALTDRLDEVATTQLVLDLFAMTHRDRRALDSEAAFNDAFTGRLDEMLAALKFVLEVNFGGFFGAVGAGIGKAVAAPGQAEDFRAG